MPLLVREHQFPRPSLRVSQPQQDEGWVGGLLTSLLGPASSVLPLRLGHLHVIQFPGGSMGLRVGWLGFLFVCAVSSLPPVLGPSLWPFLAFL